MTEEKSSPYLAFSFLLLSVITGSVIVQTMGHVLDVPLAHVSPFIALFFGLWLTYGYFFGCKRKNIMVGLVLAAILALISIASRHSLDFTSDGLGYQQPSAEAIMNGWNPFGPPPAMLWQDVYPSGAWGAEAALAFLYGSIETTKMLQIWWLFIALPVLLYGLKCHKGSLTREQGVLAVFCVLSSTVLCQMLTHYVDAFIYLSGITFIGALLMYGSSARNNLLSTIIMCACILFIVNAKLTGIYHAFMLCFMAIIFAWMRTKQLPWKLGIILGLAGLAAILVIGYRPYVTSFIHYGTRLFPGTEDFEAFSGVQRPSSFDKLYGFERYFYSLFSITGGAPHEPAQLKWSWEIRQLEWKFSGDPDARTGGFGPLFALGFICSLWLVFVVAILKKSVDIELIVLAALCLLFSACFPQSWWARYVPFGYAVPFLLLFSLPEGNRIICAGIYTVIAIFAVNSAFSVSSAFYLFQNNQAHFMDVAKQLHAQPQGSVYLVPPVANYAKYNDAYMPLQRRLKEQGVETTLKVGAPCPHMVQTYAEYKICY